MDFVNGILGYYDIMSLCGTVSIYEDILLWPHLSRLGYQNEDRKIDKRWEHTLEV